MSIIEKAFARTQSPLFVHLCASEVAKWRSYTSNAEMKLGSTIEEAVHVLFDRLERTHGAVLVSTALAALVASKNGLSETEMEDILSLDNDVLCDCYIYWKPPDADKARVPPLVWARFKHDLREFIMDRSADNTTVMGIYHKQFTEVILQRYLSNRVAKSKVHDLLIEYFSGQFHSKPKAVTLKVFNNSPRDFIRCVPKQGMYLTGKRINQRKLSELPHNLKENGKWSEFRKWILLNFEWLAADLESSSNVTSLLGHFESYLTANAAVKPVESVRRLLLMACGIELGTYPIPGQDGQTVGKRSANQLAFDILARTEHPTTSHLRDLAHDAREYLANQANSGKVPIPVLIPLSQGLDTPLTSALEVKITSHTDSGLKVLWAIPFKVDDQNAFRLLVVSEKTDQSGGCSLGLWDLKTCANVKTLHLRQVLSRAEIALVQHKHAVHFIDSASNCIRSMNLVRGIVTTLTTLLFDKKATKTLPEVVSAGNRLLESSYCSRAGFLCTSTNGAYTTAYVKQHLHLIVEKKSSDKSRTKTAWSRSRQSYHEVIDVYATPVMLTNITIVDQSVYALGSQVNGYLYMIAFDKPPVIIDIGLKNSPIQVIPMIASSGEKPVVLCDCTTEGSTMSLKVNQQTTKMSPKLVILPSNRAVQSNSRLSNSTSLDSGNHSDLSLQNGHKKQKGRDSVESVTFRGAVKKCEAYCSSESTVVITDGSVISWIRLTSNENGYTKLEDSKETPITKLAILQSSQHRKTRYLAAYASNANTLHILRWERQSKSRAAYVAVTKISGGPNIETYQEYLAATCPSSSCARLYNVDRLCASKEKRIELTYLSDNFDSADDMAAISIEKHRGEKSKKFDVNACSWHASKSELEVNKITRVLDANHKVHKILLVLPQGGILFDNSQGDLFCTTETGDVKKVAQLGDRVTAFSINETEQILWVALRDGRMLRVNLQNGQLNGQTSQLEPEISAVPLCPVLSETPVLNRLALCQITSTQNTSKESTEILAIATRNAVIIQSHSANEKGELSPVKIVKSITQRNFGSGNLSMRQSEGRMALFNRNTVNDSKVVCMDCNESGKDEDKFTIEQEFNLKIDDAILTNSGRCVRFTVMAPKDRVVKILVFSEYLNVNVNTFSKFYNLIDFAN